MKRFAALALAAPALLVAGLALERGAVRAQGKDEQVQKVEKKVVVRHAGGGRLGVVLGEAEGDLRGAKVQSVEEGSPAEKAGIKKDDLIVRFDGEAVRSAGQLARLVGETPAGRTVPVEVTRAGATQKLTATLAEGGRSVRVFSGAPGMREFHLEMPDFEAPEPPEPPEPPAPPVPPAAPHAPRAPMPHAWSWNSDGGHDMVFRMLGGGPRRLGIEYMEIGEQLAGYFKLAGKSGVLVSSVDADGAAGKGGMKAGDVVLKLDGKAIEDGSDLREAVSEAEGGKEVAVTVQRDGRPVDLKVTLAPLEKKVIRRAPGVSM
jgi:S1-C subfamily serine protease